MTLNEAVNRVTGMLADCQRYAKELHESDVSERGKIAGIHWRLDAEALLVILEELDRRKQK